MSMGQRVRIGIGALCLVAGCDAELGTEIGPEGGLVVSEDGRLSLHVPPGALEQDEVLRISPMSAPGTAVGNAYRITPTGLQFERPATLTYDFAFDPAEDTDPPLAGMAEATAVETLTLITRRGDQWRALPDRDLDQDAATLSASVVYLSSYAVTTR